MITTFRVKSNAPNRNIRQALEIKMFFPDITQLNSSSLKCIPIGNNVKMSITLCILLHI